MGAADNELSLQSLDPHSLPAFGRESVVTCVKLSMCSEYLAIGFENGSILLYTLSGDGDDDTNDINDCNSFVNKEVCKLESHSSPVYALQFSPWSSKESAPSLPVILVSSSQELCFWNVTYAINNSPTYLQQRFMKTSLRFNGGDLSPLSDFCGKGSITMSNSSSASSGIGSNDVSVDAELLTSAETKAKAVPSNIWSGMLGPSNKPELLACIKYVGNRADQIFSNEAFTSFLTVDDEGEIYFLRICDVLHQLQVSAGSIS